MDRMRVRSAWVVALLALAAAVHAAPPEGALTGRLAHIRATGIVHVGYREQALPFSYLGAGGAPIGYSLDLCRAIVAAIADEVGRGDLAVEYVRVTPQDRIERVATGDVDLECGATTSTAARRARVAFSPVVFVTGTRLAVPRASGVRSVAALAGKRVAVVAGTSNEAAMRDVARLRRIAFTLVPFAGYPEALAALRDGAVAALAADEVLLRGARLRADAPRDFRIVGELLSLEPYGIVYPRDDPALADVVTRALGALAASREIAWIYDRWFTRPLPGGGNLDMPMSVPLRRAFELIGLPPD